jgi:hypothetical protein
MAMATPTTTPHRFVFMDPCSLLSCPHGRDDHAGEYGDKWARFPAARPPFRNLGITVSFLWI